MTRRIVVVLALVVAAATLGGMPPAESATVPVVGPLTTRGSTIRDGNGHVILLRGIARSGLEYGTQSYSPLLNSNGCAPAHVQCSPVMRSDIDFIAAWRSNIVRVPVSEDLWNQSCPTPHYPGMTGYDAGYR